MRDFFEAVLGRHKGLSIKEDNQATIKIARRGYSAKLRHINRTQKVDLSSIKERLEEKDTEIEYIDTNEQIADFMTKAVPPQKWPKALSLMNLTIIK